MPAFQVSHTDRWHRYSRRKPLQLDVKLGDPRSELIKCIPKKLHGEVLWVLFCSSHVKVTFYHANESISVPMMAETHIVVLSFTSLATERLHLTLTISKGHFLNLNSDKKTPCNVHINHGGFIAGIQRDWTRPQTASNTKLDSRLRKITCSLTRYDGW